MVDHEREQPAAARTRVDHMWRVMRDQDVRTRVELDLLLADGEGELAVEHVERLRRRVMAVRHGPRAPAAAELAERERSDAMGQWGACWLEIEPQHMEPAYVLWATTKLVDVDALPDRPVVVRFEMSDRPAESYWLLLPRPQPELCTKGTGYVEDIVARTDSACLIDIHLKRTTYRQAVRAGRLTLAGLPKLTRDLMTWIRPSPYADVVPASVEGR
jgi:hypothetical protein